jgi:hypothetical protein
MCLLVFAGKLLADEENAVDALKMAGASLDRDRKTGQVTAIHLRAEKKLPPGILANVASLSKCTRVSIRGREMTDGDLLGLLEAKQIESLSLTATAVTDEGLKPLSQWKNLKHLNLFSTKIGNEGLKYIRVLEQLETLNLDATAVTNEGLKSITPLKQLQVLILANNQHITDEGVQTLAPLKQLENLSFRRSRVTIASLKVLEEFTDLKHLHIQMPSGADEHFHRIEKLKKLKGVRFHDLRVDDRILGHLIKLEELEVLGLQDCEIIGDITQLTRLKRLRTVDFPEGVSLDKVRIIQKSLPSVQVYVNGSFIYKDE